eukprot:scaffold1237_cov243-Pinguiococcus_pyrenoidosus.AAC.1
MALRRNVRLRKEYLYRKSLEGKERAAYEKKRQVREALAEGKPLPTEVRSEARELREAAALEDDYTAVPKTHIDDEYRDAGSIDPKICVTTSRSPSARLRQFSKEVKLLFPNAQSINRGNTKLAELIDACRGANFSDVVVLSETRGEPDGLIVSHLPVGPTAYFTLSGAVLRHDIKDIGTMSEQVRPRSQARKERSPPRARGGRLMLPLCRENQPSLPRAKAGRQAGHHVRQQLRLHQPEASQLPARGRRHCADRGGTSIRVAVLPNTPGNAGAERGRR